MPQGTYFETFRKPLRKYPPNPHATAGPVQVSQTVQNEEVPWVLVRAPVSRYTDKAWNFLNNEAGNVNSPLKELATTRIFQALTNEADVKALAYVHLIHPVMLALNVLHNGELEVCAEKTASNKLRPDLTIRMKDQPNDEAIALLEFKHLAAIDEDQFRAASCDGKNIPDRILALQNQGFESALDKYDEALKLYKQITAYVKRKGCRYGVLCDYGSLTLFRYNFILRNGRIEDLDYDSVRITVVPSIHFLPALLGFLIEACKDLT